MGFLPYLIVGVLSYLLGSIPFGFILVLLFRKEDIRTKGSGNIGATNVVRSGAKGLGALTFLLDAAKGYVAVVIAGLIFSHFSLSGPALEDAGAIAGVAAILGHMFPVWLGFRGGKGVATALGVFLALAPLAALIGLAVFALVFALWRYVSLASIVSAIAFPIAVFLLSRSPHTRLFVSAVIVIPLIVIVKHRQNISRLLAGTEYRFGPRRAGTA